MDIHAEHERLKVAEQDAADRSDAIVNAYAHGATTTRDILTAEDALYRAIVARCRFEEKHGL
jgi:outer membrane protein TolC